MVFTGVLRNIYGVMSLPMGSMCDKFIDLHGFYSLVIKYGMLATMEISDFPS